MFSFVFSVIFTSTYVFVGQRSWGSCGRLHPPVFIGKEIRILSQFKHLVQVLVPVLQLLVCACRNLTVTTILFFQCQYAPTRSEYLWRILHDTFHFPKIIQYDIVHLRSVPEEFLQVLVIRTIVPRQVVLLFPRIGIEDVTAVSGRGWQLGSYLSKILPCRYHRELSHISPHIPLEHCNGV